MMLQHKIEILFQDPLVQLFKIYQAIDTNSPVIKFIKTNDFCIPVKINSINDFSISLKNDSGQYINLNNQHFNLTLEFTILKDIPRFKLNFQNVIKNV